MGNFKDVAVIDVLVKPGDSIEVDTPLVTLETDKATMDVPSTAVGVVEKLHASKGGKVNTGDLIATVRAADGAIRRRRQPAGPQRCPLPQARQLRRPPRHAAPQPPGGAGRAGRRARAAAREQPAAQPAAAQRRRRTRAQRSGSPIDEPGFSRAHAGPSVRKLRARARRGSGAGQRPRLQGPHHARRRQGVRQGRARRRYRGRTPGAAGAAGDDRSAGSAGGRLRAVRTHDHRAAVAHPAHLRSAPARELGEHPARHAVRRGGHHRARAGARRD